MGLVVVVLLVGLWVSILLPGALRARRASSPLDTVSDFERSMSMLSPVRDPARLPGRTILVLQDPQRVTIGSRRSRVLSRRRRSLVTLGTLTGVTAAAALVWPAAVLLFAACATAFVGYVAVLRHLATQAASTRTTVRRLPREPGPARDGLRATGT